MSDDKVKAYIIRYSSYVPQEKLSILKNKLSRADESDEDSLYIVKLYNPTIILILSIFLGGLAIDRFVLGDIGLAVCKLLFGWFLFPWIIIDMFLSYKRAKEKNFINIVNCL